MAHMLRTLTNLTLNTCHMRNHLVTKTAVAICNNIMKRNATFWKTLPTDSVATMFKKMDENARKAGRLYKKDLEDVLKKIEETRLVSSTQTVMLLRACGNWLVEEPYEERIEILRRAWKTFEHLGTKFDVTHYNVLLKVYLENEYDFKPAEILAEMQKKGCKPNRVTYQRLISRYCLSGDVEGATNMLHEMRGKNIPIDISIFNSLIIGHSRVNDMESAEGILEVLKEAGMKGTSETFTCLICEYIRHGNIEKADALLKYVELSNVNLTAKDHFDILHAYATNGHRQEVDEALKNIAKTIEYHHEALNFVLRMVTLGLPELAYKVLLTIRRPNRVDGSLMPLGGFFIAHTVKCDVPTDLVIKYCIQLMKDNLNPFALNIAMEKCLRLGKKREALALFKAAKENHTPVRDHYFWPLLLQCGKENDIQGMLNILVAMDRDFQLTVNTETLREVVMPSLLEADLSIDDIIFKLKACGASVSAVVSSMVINLLKKNEIKKAADIGETYGTYYSMHFVRKPLIDSFLATKDVDSFTKLLREVAGGIQWFSENRDKESIGEYNEKYDFRDFTGQLVVLALRPLVDEGTNDLLIEALFDGLKNYRVGISVGYAMQVRNILRRSVSPKIESILQEIVSSAYAKAPPKSKGNRLVMSSVDVLTLERLYETKNEKKENASAIQKHLFMAYARDGNLDKMSKLLQEMESDKFVFTAGMYITLMNMYVDQDQGNKALKVYEAMVKKERKVTIDHVKLLKFVHVLVQKDEASKALQVLKNHISVNGERNDDQKAPYAKNLMCRKILEALAEKDDVQNMDEFLNFVTTKGITQVNSILLGPCIKVFLKRGDLKAAIEEFEKYVLKYKLTPWKNELLRVCIENEDLVNLQRILDLGSQVHGDSNSYHDLIFVFLESGRIDEAKKLCHTTGLQIRPDRFLNVAFKYYNDGDIENLKNLLKLTKGLSIVDRSKLYYFLLCTYDKANDVKNALGTWTQLQEEDVQISNEFLITLANVLKRNNKPTPFEVPAGVIDDKLTSQEFGKVRVSAAKRKLVTLLKEGKLDEALELKKRYGDVRFNMYDWSSLIDACIEKERYQEAKQLFSDYYSNYKELPLFRSSKLLFKSAMKLGDIEIFQEYDSLLSYDLKKRVSFDNYLSRTYLKANRCDEYLAILEAQLNEVKNDDDFEKYIEHFPRGGILSIMLQQPEYASRCEKLLSRCLDRKDKYQVPPNILWLYHMLKKNYEEADRIWEVYLQNSTNRLSFTKLNAEIQKTGDVELGMKMLSMAENKRDIQPRTLGVIYGVVISALVKNNTIQDALNILDRAVSRVDISEIRRTDLISLKIACAANNIEFPYEIPTRVVPADYDSDDDSQKQCSSF